MRLLLVFILLVKFIYASQDILAIYGGFGVGTGSGEYTFEGPSSTTTYNTDYSLVDAKFGFIDLDNDRIEVSFTSIDFKGDGLADRSYTGIDVDFILTLDVHDDIFPFASLGVGTRTWNDTASLTEEGVDIEGTGFNLGVGVYYWITREIEIEASYKMKTIEWSDLDIAGSIYKPSDVMSIGYIGIKFMFSHSR